MTLYAKGTFTGNYEPVERAVWPDLISLHEWGIEDNGPGPITMRLAEMALGLQEALPFHVDIVGTQQSSEALHIVSGGSSVIRPIHLVGGVSSNTIGQGTGSKGEVTKVRQVMDEEGLELPLLLGQAHHIGRVGLQAMHVGIPAFIIPRGLPREFSPHSSQLWTHNRLVWSIRELIGVPALHMLKKF